MACCSSCDKWKDHFPTFQLTIQTEDNKKKNLRALFTAIAAVATSATLPKVATADTFTWTGGGANKNWSTVANWSPSGTMTSSDTANFQTGTLSSDTIIYDSGAFLGLTVQSGAWTANVASASFTGKPITVASGAKFALAGASGVTNPFSTTKNANYVAGLLDLGGASQTIADDMGGNNAGFFRNGGEIRNGNLTVSGTPTANLINTTFTIGPGANLSGAVRYYLYYGANLVIDGGSLTSTTTGANHPIGTSSGYAYVRVKNGGKLKLAKPVWLGFTARGFLIGDNGTIDLGSSDLYLSVHNNTTGVLALTNSMLTCGQILYGYSSTYPTPNTQTVSMKDSVAVISKFVGTIKATSSSSLNFDGAVLVPRAAATDFLPNSSVLPTPTLGAGGLIVSNSYDVTIAKGMAGAGKLVKKGEGVLTLSGTNNSFTGGIDVREGGLSLGETAAFADSTLAMASGTTLRLKYSPDGGFASSNLVLSLDANLEGKITLDIDTSAGAPEVNSSYTLLAYGLDAASLDRITVVSDCTCSLSVSDGGALMFTFLPTTHTWTGGGADEKWTTTANWDTDDDFKAFDHVVFNSATGHSIYDCTDGLGLGSITAASGVHTANVATASFANVPVTVTSGATFALENANGVTNAFSTVANKNAIAGVLDLGGSTQTFNGANAFRNGGEVCNGTVKFAGADHVMNYTTFTFGKEANLSGSVRFYLQNGAHFILDGAAYTNSNSNSHVIGGTANGALAMLEVSNGGRLTTQRDWYIGHNGPAALIGDGGIIDFGTNTIYFSNNNYGSAVIALTNSVLTCGSLNFGYASNKGAAQTLVLKDTTVNLSKIVYNHKTPASSILFDGATLVPKAAAATFVPSGLPTPQLGTGGLIISNAFDVGVALGMAGAGGLVKTGGGKLTVSANQSFTGDVVVSGGTFNSSNTFAGGLQAASGATLNVTNATFGGNIAIADGVVFAATNGVNWAEVNAVPVAKTTASVVAFPGGYDADGRHFFVMPSDGKNVLYFGKQRGLKIMFR